jgi:hypothetical protein
MKTIWSIETNNTIEAFSTLLDLREIERATPKYSNTDFVEEIWSSNIGFIFASFLACDYEAEFVIQVLEAELEKAMTPNIFAAPRHERLKNLLWKYLGSTTLDQPKITLRLPLLMQMEDDNYELIIVSKDRPSFTKYKLVDLCIAAMSDYFKLKHVEIEKRNFKADISILTPLMCASDLDRIGTKSLICIKANDIIKQKYFQSLLYTNKTIKMRETDVMKKSQFSSKKTYFSRRELNTFLTGENNQRKITISHPLLMRGYFIYGKSVVRFVRKPNSTNAFRDVEVVVYADEFSTKTAFNDFIEHMSKTANIMGCLDRKMCRMKIANNVEQRNRHEAIITISSIEHI